MEEEQFVESQRSLADQGLASKSKPATKPPTVKAPTTTPGASSQAASSSSPFPPLPMGTGAIVAGSSAQEGGVADIGQDHRNKSMHLQFQEMNDYTRQVLANPKLDPYHPIHVWAMREKLGLQQLRQEDQQRREQSDPEKKKQKTSMSTSASSQGDPSSSSTGRDELQHPCELKTSCGPFCILCLKWSDGLHRHSARHILRLQEQMAT